MILQCDTLPKRKHHLVKEKYFESMGIKLVDAPMLIGNYGIPSDGSVVVDTEGNISGLYDRLFRQYDKFCHECILAGEAGVRRCVVVENREGITDPDHLLGWKNPQVFRYWKEKARIENSGRHFNRKMPETNEELISRISMIKKAYGTEFIFCRPEDAGSEILQILGVFDGRGNDENK